MYKIRRENREIKLTCQMKANNSLQTHKRVIKLVFGSLSCRPSYSRRVASLTRLVPVLHAVRSSKLILPYANFKIPRAYTCRGLNPENTTSAIGEMTI